jgi:hypothetical protein
VDGLEVADKFASQGRHDVALKVLEDRLKKNPADYEARRRYGEMQQFREKNEANGYGVPRVTTIQDLDSSSRMMSPARKAMIDKLHNTIIQEIDFREITARAALETVTQKTGVAFVWMGAEGNQLVTLKLSKVPAIETVKYVCSLANLKYTITDSGVTVSPIGVSTEEMYIKEWRVSPEVLERLKGDSSGAAPAGFLAARGTTFSQGAFAMYSPASGTLIVKNSPDQLERIEAMIASVSESRKTAGLLPVLLELPKHGRPLVFAGLYGPEQVTLRYDDWWSRARRLWMWFIAGGLLFYAVARPRPWWRTLWAMLVLTALPFCGMVAWTAVCNAVLAGWLVALGLNRLAVWCVFRARKEVLA